MSARVISKNIGDRQGTVIVEADTQEEVQGQIARQLALKEAAAAGLSRPGLSGNDSPYPVDSEGKTSDALMLGRGEVAGYRCDFSVTGMI